MYLKRIEIAGFKSFADKTEMEFVFVLRYMLCKNGTSRSNSISTSNITDNAEGHVFKL